MTTYLSTAAGWGVELAATAGLLLLGALYARGRGVRLRQAARRGHEFEILTHIGTTLNSSLDADALLLSIHTQLQKLMDVRNFYVAFLESERDEIRFAFEVEEGYRLPPRRRPRSNAITEHIIATGQSLLVSGNVGEYGRALGLSPSGRNAKNYLGVPIILQGRACGVLAVQSYEREDAYDAEHQRVLEILAGQAAVALDNARLFAAVQRDAGQKAFLNHVARLAISTMSPAEMLTTVVAEVARAFPYHYVAVAVPRAETVPDAIALDVCANSGAPRDEACALALPIQHSGRRLAVLQLETIAPQGLPLDQLLVLQTLADQIAVALNHANLFQQMQQQAITDSLTGLKTRRFFMEALQAEWRRASGVAASGKPAAFCIVLLDLDEFKPLNDNFGHLEGDRILMRVAQLLERKCRASSVVARYGGDEFTILVPDCEPATARGLRERLRHAIAEDPVLAERRVRCSLGLALYPDSGATPEELLRSADADMYAAKQGARPRAR